MGVRNVVGGEYELEGRCKNCRRDVSIKLLLSEPVQIRTGGIFRPRYELFLPAAVQGSSRCPHCDWNFFGESHR